MKKKLIATIIGLTMVSGAGVGITAYAETLSLNNEVTVVNQNNQYAIGQSQQVNENNNTNSGISIFRNIKQSLENGETVSQIKTNMINNFESKLNNQISIGNINKNQANQMLKQYSEGITKDNILDGIVKNEIVMNSLNYGKTLTQAEENLMQIKTEQVNKLVVDNKITSLQGINRIASINRDIETGNAIFYKLE